MGLFGRKKKDLVVEGLPGTAVVEQMGDAQYAHTKRDDAHLSDLGIGNVRYPLVLEVTLDDGRAPYKVQGTFKVPARISTVGGGVTLPVYADPVNPSRVQINWDRFVSDGGAEVPGVTPESVHAGFADASRQQMVSGWVKAAQGGQMTRAQFDEAIDGAVKGGLLTEAEGETARASLG